MCVCEHQGPTHLKGGRRWRSYRSVSLRRLPVFPPNKPSEDGKDGKEESAYFPYQRWLSGGGVRVMPRPDIPPSLSLSHVSSLHRSPAFHTLRHLFKVVRTPHAHINRNVNMVRDITRMIILHNTAPINTFPQPLLFPIRLFSPNATPRSPSPLASRRSG